MAFSIILSCEEEEESNIVIFLEPEEAVIETNTNEHLFLVLEAKANKGELTGFTITQKDEYFGIKTLVDSSFELKSVNFSYDFIVPEFPDSTETILTFMVRNNLGEQVQAAKRIIVNKGSSLVTVSTGNVIYSRLSDKPNAFNLKEMTPGYISDLFDIDVDFMDNSIDSINGNNLSREWVSRNGLNFVQYNSFNFAMANSTMIVNAYESGIKLTKAVGIEDSDIYLIGRNNNAIGAVQLVSITDSDSTLNDKYVFNIKILDSYFDN